MALDASTFETLTPSRFISFTIPHPSFSNTPLRVAVLDSPLQPNDVPQVGAMLVPEGREIDWIFSTELGHLQLLLSSPEISRLILIGNNFMEDRDSSSTWLDGGFLSACENVLVFADASGNDTLRCSCGFSALEFPIPIESSCDPFGLYEFCFEKLAL
ncbi:uncharacterized protein LOC106772352 [Vigna radiata var. radiata]|uniref:Uncharacterized protein LOC106772352 n=1 Tax=Vigna radiata var. radiata TaxID=3916 RepID=A0A3Q0FCY6_VIGRR|nr:uncharacterized protein LOC106772352 [Vigna radiata var. radiata]